VRGDVVETTALEALKENPQAVADFKDREEEGAHLDWGAVMKKMKGKVE
jgi:Asp-tRNA(Asn)/Glu-tRNA(Gln) amidotransferase B subunit